MLTTGINHYRAHQAWSKIPGSGLASVPLQMTTTHQNDEPHKLSIGAFPALAGNDVPLLGGADNDLSGADLLLAQLVVTS